MKDTLRDQGIVVLLYSLLLRGFAAGETIPPFPELSEVLNVRGGPLKTPFDAECMDEDPVGCPIRAARGDCFGIPGWAKYNGSLDLTNYSKGLNWRRAMDTVAECKATCHQQYRDVVEHGTITAEADKVVGQAGGWERDSFVDILGYEHHICDLKDGRILRSTKTIIMWNTEAWKSYTGNDPRSHALGVRQYNPIGFTKSVIPEDLLARINAFYFANRDHAERWQHEDDESRLAPGGHLTVVDDGYESRLEIARTTLVMHPGRDLEIDIIKTLWPLAEKWAGVKLYPNNLYGIRRYLRGAWLGVHVDRVDTHIVSFILNLGQDVDQPWPLDIMGYDGTTNRVLLEPGDMVYYESSRLPHARVQRFKGNFYDNIFIHYRLATQKPEELELRREYLGEEEEEEPSHEEDGAQQ